MVLTLDSGQTITIFENDNVIEQIKPYIDGEIYNLLSEHYRGIDTCLLELENLKEEKADCDKGYNELQDNYYDLEEDYDRQTDELEEKEQIIEQIEQLNYEIKRDRTISTEEIIKRLNDILD